MRRHTREGTERFHDHEGWAAWGRRSPCRCRSSRGPIQLSRGTGVAFGDLRGYSREPLSMRVYEPKEAAVAILERQLALNSREIASARASTQHQPGSNGVLGSASAEGFPGGHTRATEEKSAQAQELYRMHRLHLLEQRKLRQQQRELSGSQQQQQQQQLEQESQQPRNRVLDGSQQQQQQQQQQRQQQQNGVLDGAALVRLLNGGLSQLGSPSEQQQQLRPREQEHHQQEQEQRVSGEDPEEALDDAKTRLEAEVAMWKGKAETSLKSYRTLLHQAQAAHRKNLIQAVENNSLASERDEMEARNVAVVKELHETRDALVEVKAELTTLKTLHARRHQHEQQQQHEQVHLQRQHQQQQREQQRRRSSPSPHASSLRSTPASARQQRLRQERLTPQADDPRTPTTTTTRGTTAPPSPPPCNARDSGGAASLLSSGAAARRRRPETAGPLPTRARPATMFGRVSAPATVPMGTRRQTAAEEAFATTGGGVAWSGSGEDAAGGRWGGDREGPAVPLPHEHGVPHCHPRASSAVALRRRLMGAGGERSKGSRGAATTGVSLREDSFPVGDEVSSFGHEGGRSQIPQAAMAGVTSGSNSCTSSSSRATATCTSDSNDGIRTPASRTVSSGKKVRKNVGRTGGDNPAVRGSKSRYASDVHVIVTRLGKSVEVTKGDRNGDTQAAAAVLRGEDAAAAVHQGAATAVLTSADGIVSVGVTTAYEAAC